MQFQQHEIIYNVFIHDWRREMAPNTTIWNVEKGRSELKLLLKGILKIAYIIN